MGWSPTDGVNYQFIANVIGGCAVRVSRLHNAQFQIDAAFRYEIHQIAVGECNSCALIINVDIVPVCVCNVLSHLPSVECCDTIAVQQKELIVFVGEEVYNAIGIAIN